MPNYITQAFRYTRQSDLNQKLDRLKMRYGYYKTKIVDVRKSNNVATVTLELLKQPVKDFYIQPK